jgi:hypothetical protein
MQMVIDIHLTDVFYQLKAKPKSTKKKNLEFYENKYSTLTGVQIRHEIAQAQPIIIDARFGVRFDRYVNGRVIEKYRSKQISKRLATDAFDMV